MASAPAIELEVDYLVYKDSSGAEVVQSVREMAAPVGGIQAFAMPTAPDGWLICDGSNNLLISDFPALYDALSADIDCTVGSGSTVVTVNDAIGTTNMSVGMGVRGVGVPVGTTIVQINTGSTFTMNNSANANNTAALRIMYWGTGANLSTFKIPDMRAEFLRGWDQNRGQDTGRRFAEFQDHGIPRMHGGFSNDHGHNGIGEQSPVTSGERVLYGAGGTSPWRQSIERVNNSNRMMAFDSNRVIPATNDVRPKNTSVQYCVKY
jgi:microcystin-dependent protein